MKQFILSIIFCMYALFCFGQTQVEMNEEAHQEYLKTDKDLNRTYKAILNIYKEDTVFIKNIQASQKLWIQFRDAEMLVIYPNHKSYYGSVFPMCWSMTLTELTTERIKKLMVWINGVEDIDVCSGSVRIKK